MAENREVLPRLSEREQMVLDAMADMEAHSNCGYAGHEWEPAGGGLLICVNCTAEKWDDELDPVAQPAQHEYIDEDFG